MLNAALTARGFLPSVSALQSAANEVWDASILTAARSSAKVLTTRKTKVALLRPASCVSAALTSISLSVVGFLDFFWRKELCNVATHKAGECYSWAVGQVEAWMARGEFYYLSVLALSGSKHPGYGAEGGARKRNWSPYFASMAKTGTRSKIHPLTAAVLCRLAPQRMNSRWRRRCSLTPIIFIVWVVRWFPLI